MAQRVCLAHENRILWNIYPKHTEAIGGKGVPDPMAGFEDVSEGPSLHEFSS